jgi:hypothetical protein
MADAEINDDALWEFCAPQYFDFRAPAAWRIADDFFDPNYSEEEWHARRARQWEAVYGEALPMDGEGEGEGEWVGLADAEGSDGAEATALEVAEGAGGGATASATAPDCEPVAIAAPVETVVPVAAICAETAAAPAVPAAVVIVEAPAAVVHAAAEPARQQADSPTGKHTVAVARAFLSPAGGHVPITEAVCNATMVPIVTPDDGSTPTRPTIVDPVATRTAMDHAIAAVGTALHFGAAAEAPVGTGEGADVTAAATGDDAASRGRPTRSTSDYSLGSGGALRSARSSLGGEEEVGSAFREPRAASLSPLPVLSPLSARGSSASTLAKGPAVIVVASPVRGRAVTDAVVTVRTSPDKTAAAAEAGVAAGDEFAAGGTMSPAAEALAASPLPRTVSRRRMVKLPSPLPTPSTVTTRNSHGSGSGGRPASLVPSTPFTSLSSPLVPSSLPSLASKGGDAALQSAVTTPTDGGGGASTGQPSAPSTASGASGTPGALRMPPTPAAAADVSARAVEAPGSAARPLTHAAAPVYDETPSLLRTARRRKAAEAATAAIHSALATGGRRGDVTPAQRTTGEAALWRGGWGRGGGGLGAATSTAPCAWPRKRCWWCRWGVDALHWCGAIRTAAPTVNARRVPARCCR